MKTNRFFLISLIAATLSIIVACGDKGVPYDDAPELQTSISVISDDSLQYPARTFIGDTLWFRVVDANNNPQPGVSVTFEQVSTRDTGFFVFKTERTTNSNGAVFNLYSTESVAGVDTLRAVASGVEDSTADVIVTVVPGDPMISIHNGDNQVGTAGEMLPAPCSVLIADQYGNPVADQRVKFRAMSNSIVETDSTGEREVDTAVTRSDDNGFAAAWWTMQVDYIQPTELRAILMDGNTPLDSVGFGAFNSPPSAYKYYNDIRPVFEDNCFLCHSGLDGYAVNYYWTLFENSNLIPGDGSSPLVDSANSEHNLNNINIVEEDKIYRWVVTDNAQPGNSGLNSYNSHMQAIFDDHCAIAGCHAGAAPDGDYDMSTHAGIRGNGLDATANAIAGDSQSLLVRSVLGDTLSMRVYLGPDSAQRTENADSIVRWIVVDSLRQY